MECRLSQSPFTSYRVSIRCEFDNKGKPLDEISEVPFGDPFTDKNDVEMALRRAQLSILNPDIPSVDILAMTPDELKAGLPKGNQLPFSRNVVCVDLSGPDLVRSLPCSNSLLINLSPKTDLYFLDLPGT